MSSLARRIQKKGLRPGTNLNAADLKARLARELKHSAKPTGEPDLPETRA